MKKIIISVSLSMFLIHLHAQTGLPYKSLSDFRNDTTAFINYNFIDRAEQYKGKALEFLVRDLQIPVKFLFGSLIGRAGQVDGLYLCFHNEVETDRLRESTVNKPYAILVNWEEKVPEEDSVSLLRMRDYDGIINTYKDLQISKIYIFYPSESEHEKSKAKLRSSEEYKDPNARFENGVWYYDLIE